MRNLTPLEARVLGVLVEKQHTVPDTYPLSLNALVAGCNQKTARSPVIEATDAEVLAAVDGLKGLSLVFEASSSRVVKFEHNLPRAHGVTPAAAGALAVLLLRGPQTAAELRLNGDRLHRLADLTAVEACLVELAERFPPRVVKLARAPGAREHRWAHLLCGDVGLPRSGADDSADVGPGHDVGAGEWAAMKAEQTRLAAQVESLRSLVERLARELGVSVD